jgi:site-specific recombinase XerD
MATIKVIGKEGKTGFKLYLRITIDRKTIDYAFKLKQPIDKKHWAEEQQIIKAGNPNYHYINSIIVSKKNEANKIISRIESEKGVVRYAEFHKIYRASIGTKGNPNDFYTFFDSVMKSKNIEKGTLKIYKVCLAKLMKFRKSVNIGEINYSFLEAFENYLRTDCKLNDGSVYNYMSKLRAVLTIAVKREEIEKNPFSNYDLNPGEGTRKFLTENELKSIMALKNLSDALERTRKMFIVQCYTGLDYANLTKISSANIKDNMLIFRRGKTKYDTSIPLIDVPLAILNELPQNEVYFSISNKSYNINLKKIGLLAELTEPLTSHIGRHTFATLALTKGISIETISSILSHKSIRTTQIYAKIIDTKKIEEMKKFNL